MTKPTFKYIKKHPNANYDDGYEFIDYEVIDGDTLDLGDIDFNEYDNFMYAIMSKYPYIHASFVSDLFAPYSGIGEPDQHVLDYVNKVLNNEVPSYGRGGEQFDFTSYPDNTIIYDMTPSFSDIKAQPITITLPTSDFKRILEHIIKQEAKQ